MEDLLAYPPRDRMPCLLLYGDTGMGKTKIIRKFLRDHPASFDKAAGVTTIAQPDAAVGAKTDEPSEVPCAGLNIDRTGVTCYSLRCVLGGRRRFGED